MPVVTPFGTVDTDQLGSGAHAQTMKLLGGAEDSTERIPGTTANGLLVDVSRIIAAVAVTGPLTRTQLDAAPIVFQRRAAATATRSSVASVGPAGPAAVLIAANANRLGLQIHNESTSVLVGAYGAGATTSSYTFKIQPGYTWEKPDDGYTGVITAVWEAANGNARITELTP